MNIQTEDFIYGLELIRKYLSQLTEQFQIMKGDLVKEFDKIISFVNEWKKNISDQKNRITDYEYLIIRNNLKNHRLNIHLIQQIKRFHEQLQEQLQEISNQIQEQISSISTSDVYIWFGQQCNEEVMKGSLVLIDDSMNQKDYCLAIAFNQSGTIMASGCGDKIKVSNFNNGKITEITTLDQNQMHIFSLFFSKNSNSFLSGCTNSINMWYTKNDQSWENVNSIHNGGAYCMILNQLKLINQCLGY